VIGPKYLESRRGMNGRSGIQIGAPKRTTSRQTLVFTGISFAEKWGRY